MIEDKDRSAFFQSIDDFLVIVMFQNYFDMHFIQFKIFFAAKRVVDVKIIIFELFKLFLSYRLIHVSISLNVYASEVYTGEELIIIGLGNKFVTFLYFLFFYYF